MSDDEEVVEYGAWRKLDEPVYPDFQLVVLRNDDTGEVLAVEKAPGHAPHDRGKPYQVVILPEDYYNDDEVLEYISKGVDREEAFKVAALYVEENK